MNVVTTCTLTLFFIYFSMIFGLRRYSKIFKIYCKNEVILNIRVFHSPDATIQNSIEKSSQNSSKINENWSKKRVKNQTPCRRPFLEPFWDHFGSILEPFWSQNRPESRPEAEKSLSGRLFKKALISDPPPREGRRQGTRLRRALTYLPRFWPEVL